MINYFLLGAALAALVGGCGQSPTAERPEAIARLRAPARIGTIDGARRDPIYTRAAELPSLRSLLVFQRDTLRREQYFHGARADQPANIKSASKSVVSALVGIAIARGNLRDVRQPWGYRGQFTFVVPDASMVVVATSDPEPERRDGSHLDAVHGLVDALLTPD